MINFKKKLLSSVLIIFFILTTFSAGCISRPIGNIPSLVIMTEQSLEMSTPQYIGDHQYWIKIDHVPDFQTESPFIVTGTTKFNITGTTNFPAGSLFWIKIVEEERSRNLMSEKTIPSSVNSTGVNTFSYPFDIQGNPPAHYRIEIRKANQNSTASEQFRIILIPSTEKSLWVHIDPIRWTQKDENLNITGTTNLPIRSEISIKSFIWAHSCPTQVPGSQPVIKTGKDSFCNGGCEEFFDGTVHIIEGQKGINSWRTSLNTSGWCPIERYYVTAEVSNWTNVTRDYQEFRFG